MEGHASKKRKMYCEKCGQIFDRLDRLAKHKKNIRLKCPHCNLKFCNVDLLHKHLRSVVEPVAEIPDIHLPIQPWTSYGSDVGLQAAKLNRIHEVTDWTKKGR
jgi:DNA-directed RNA polymerase subunit RPC12/RpoP